jgi:3-hydroxymyristoyl/3-hydroxydecanoyl-(acyl carrier protein) dehydratase
VTGLIATLLAAPPSRALFVRDSRLITAGEIRAAALAARARIDVGDAPLFLHTESAAMLAAGLLVGASLGRTIAILPHAQPAYLQEVGAAPGSLLSDSGDMPLLTLAGSDATLEADENPQLLFFTSGSTGAPKQAPKRMRQVDAEAEYWVDWFGDDADNVAGSVSHQHIYGLLFRIAVPVMAGWRSTDTQAFAWEAFAAELGPRCVGVTSPAHLTRFPPELVLPNGPPAFVLSSGQALPLTGALDAARVFGEPPIEILGSTETGGVAWRARRDDAEPWTPLGPVATQLDDKGVLEVASPFADTGLGFIRMGDRAEMLEDGRFRLQGRADRIVKIEGKRVSLARVEDALKALPGVADAAALGVAAGGGEQLAAVLVLTPAGGAELAAAGAFRYSRELRKRLSVALEPAERPKRWRFVGRMPANAQGKRVLADLVGLFDGPSMMALLDAKLTALQGDTAHIAFTLRPDLPWLEGHFPGAPVLPGVAQVHIAVRLAEEIWGFLPATFDVSRLKFRRIMPPTGEVALQLTRDAPKNRLSFAFALNGASSSEGVIG